GDAADEWAGVSRQIVALPSTACRCDQFAGPEVLRGGAGSDAAGSGPCTGETRRAVFGGRAAVRSGEHGSSGGRIAPETFRSSGSTSGSRDRATGGSTSATARHDHCDRGIDGRNGSDSAGSDGTPGRHAAHRDHATYTGGVFRGVCETAERLV